MNKKFFILFLLGAVFMAISCREEASMSGQSGKKPDIKVKHPRVLWVENPASHAIISWTTTAEGTDHYVEYGTSSVIKKKSVDIRTKESAKDGLITRSEADMKSGVLKGYFHHAELDELIPDTKYFFRVCSDGVCSKELHFYTAPENGSGFSLLFGGDSRFGGGENYGGSAPHSDRQNVNKLISTLAEEDESILAFVHGADYCSTAEWRFLYWWFEDHMLTYTKSGRVLPLVAARGNHDMDIGFQENFWLGSLSEENPEHYYYATSFSDDVSLITLNTEISTTGDQLRWLESNLETIRPKRKWLFVQYHKPAFPAVKDYEYEQYVRLRKHWVPLFEKHNVDLVVESDGHAMKKTVPIRNGAYSPDGIIYIGEGGLGVPLRKTRQERWYFQGHDSFAEMEHHVWKVKIQDETAEVSAIGIKKNIFHTFTLKAK